MLGSSVSRSSSTLSASSIASLGLGDGESQLQDDHGIDFQASGEGEDNNESEDEDEATGNRQPTPPVVLNLQPDLPSIENEGEFPGGINYHSTPLHSPIFSTPPQYITIGK